MANSNEYTTLIAGYHAQKPKFQKWVFALTEPLRIARERLALMQVQDFDLDMAVGAQLDAVGARIGLNRRLPIPVTDAFFALDDVDGIGLDLGVWLTKLDTTSILVTMSDNVYRMALKAKVRLNHYDGTRQQIVSIVRDLFESFNSSDYLVTVVDSQDMNFTIGMVKSEMSPILLELIQNRILDTIAAGVGANFDDMAQVRFGFDVNTTSVKGFDLGFWGNT